MNCLIPIFVIISIFGYVDIASGCTSEDDTLVLVHTLMRHGNRIPNNKAYSNNPINNESYYPEGYGQLSNKGKRTSYHIGTTLRQRYNKFLGSFWNINYIEARSSNANRTKMSLQLMLAGLWPPTGQQRWQPWFNWQPIPYNYATVDKELKGNDACKNFRTMNKEILNSADIQEKLSVYRKYFKYISNYSGDTFENPDDAFNIYMDQMAQEDYGYPLEPWVKAVWPILERMTREVYYLETNTTDLKKIAAGYLLKKMIQDSKAKIDGLIKPQSRKMFIYAAHERNIAHVLITLGVYDGKIPAYGAHILFELHLIGGIYGYKVYHQNWDTPEPKLLTIPGCQAFCPFDDFVYLLQNVMPDDSLCITSS